MVMKRSPIIFGILVALTAFGLFRDVFGEWMAIKGCRTLQDKENVSHFIYDNRPETCLGSCPQNTSYIAMQGRQCVCEELLTSFPTYKNDCVVCSGDDTNCTVMYHASWLVYEKVSSYQLDYFDLDNMEQNQSACVVVETRPDDLTLSFKPINCSLSLRYLCYLPPIFSRAECEGVLDAIRWSPTITSLCPKVLPRMEPVTTKEQLNACVVKNLLKTDMTAGIRYWLGIRFIKREVLPTTTIHPTTSSIASPTSPTITKSSPTLTALTTSTIKTPLSSITSTRPSGTFSRSLMSLTTRSTPLTRTGSTSIAVLPTKLTVNRPQSARPNQNSPVNMRPTNQPSAVIQATDSNNTVIIILAVIGGVLLVIVAAAVWCFARQNRTFLKALTNQHRVSGQEFGYAPGPRSIILTDNGRYIDAGELRDVDESMFNNRERYPVYSAPPSVFSNGSTLHETNNPARHRTYSEINSPYGVASINRFPGDRRLNNVYSLYPDDTSSVRVNPIFSNSSVREESTRNTIEAEQSTSRPSEPTYSVVDRGTHI